LARCVSFGRSFRPNAFLLCSAPPFSGPLHSFVGSPLFSAFFPPLTADPLPFLPHGVHRLICPSILFSEAWLLCALHRCCLARCLFFVVSSYLLLFPGRWSPPSPAALNIMAARFDRHLRFLYPYFPPILRPFLFSGHELSFEALSALVGCLIYVTGLFLGRGQAIFFSFLRLICKFRFFPPCQVAPTSAIFPSRRFLHGGHYYVPFPPSQPVLFLFFFIDRPKSPCDLSPFLWIFCSFPSFLPHFPR